MEQKTKLKVKTTLKPNIVELNNFNKIFEHDKMIAIRTCKCNEPLLLYLLMRNENGYDIMILDSSRNVQGIRCKHTKRKREMEHILSTIKNKFHAEFITCFAVDMLGKDIDMLTIDKRNINETNTIYNIV